MAELEDLQANPERLAKGTVLEASLDKKSGPVATLLVQAGTLRVGDIVAAGSALGKVRGAATMVIARTEQSSKGVPMTGGRVGGWEEGLHVRRGGTWQPSQLAPSASDQTGSLDHSHLYCWSRCPPGEVCATPGRTESVTPPPPLCCACFAGAKHAQPHRRCTRGRAQHCGADDGAQQRAAGGRRV